MYIMQHHLHLHIIQYSYYYTVHYMYSGVCQPIGSTYVPPWRFLPQCIWCLRFLYQLWTYQPYHITYTYCTYIRTTYLCGNNCAEHIRSVASSQTRIYCVLKHVLSCVCRFCAKNASADLSVHLAHRHHLHTCQPKHLCHITEDTDSFLLQVILDLQIKGPSANRNIQIWHQSNDQ